MASLSYCNNDHTFLCPCKEGGRRNPETPLSTINGRRPICVGEELPKTTRLDCIYGPPNVPATKHGLLRDTPCRVGGILALLLVESYSIACFSTPIFVLAAYALRLSLRHGHRYPGILALGQHLSPGRHPAVSGPSRRARSASDKIRMPQLAALAGAGAYFSRLPLYMKKRKCDRGVARSWWDFSFLYRFPRDSRHCGR